MKIYKSLPKDNAFFSRYATLTPTLYKLGFLAQIVSALTEVGIIYSIVYSGTAEIFPDLAPIFAAVGAIIGTAFLEIGLRKFVPYGVRSILFRRFSGLDLAMTLFILLTAVGLLFTSGSLSFRGSKSMVAAVAPLPVELSTLPIDSLHRIEKQNIRESYSRDSLEIVTRYQRQIEAQTAAFTSRLDAERAVLRKYTSREQRTGDSYATRKENSRARIEEIKADLAAKLAVLQEALAEELAKARNRMEASREELSAHVQNERAKVEEKNRSNEQEAAAVVSRYGGGLAWFTIVCLLVFVLSVAIHEIYSKGSGIEEKAIPTAYHFAPGIFAEIRSALNGKWQYFTRSRIQRIEKAIPPPPLPVLPAALYDVGDLQQYRYRIETEETPGEQVIYLPSPLSAHGGTAGELERKAIDYLQASARLEKDNPPIAKELELRAEDVIKAYLGPQGTPGAVADLKQGIIQYLNGTGENPFAHHHRRSIGFQKVQPSSKQKSKGDEASVTNATVNGLSPTGCKHCTDTFTPKVAWQKFCSEKCRLDYHAKKHGGKRYDPKFHRRSRKGL